MAVSVLAAAGVALAQDTGTSPVINPTPDEAWMTNGIVYSIIRHGDYVYVGGKFTRVQSAPGGESFRATNVARFDAQTGVGDRTWTPDVTGADAAETRVYALAAAGDKIFVGGKFEAVDGIARRNLAAVDPLTATVDPTVDTLVGSETSPGIRAMVASGTTVYLGGQFGTLDGRIRQNLGAIGLSGNVDATWKPKTNRYVRALSFSCDGSAVFAGGVFRNAAGSDGVEAPRETIARFDAATGALDPWALPAGTVGTEEVAADLAVTCERVTAGFLGPNFTRSFRLDNGSTGTEVWEKKSAGDVQTVAMLGSDKVILGGHFSQVDRQRRLRIAAVNLSDGSVDPAWSPSIEGDVNGDFAWGPWDLLVDGNRLYVGGGFRYVAGQTRTNFASFTTVSP
jgi:hypothetical protein